MILLETYMASDQCDLKRKYMSITYDDYFIICVSAIRNVAYLNMIFSRPVIKDIIDDEGFDLDKTELIHVQLSKNI